jgi:hypothetical protein
MYVVVTIKAMPDGIIQLETHGPFDNERKARTHARAITWKCLTFVEYVWSV